MVLTNRRGSISGCIWVGGGGAGSRRKSVCSELLHVPLSVLVSMAITPIDRLKKGISCILFGFDATFYLIIERLRVALPLFLNDIESAHITSFVFIVEKNSIRYMYFDFKGHSTSNHFEVHYEIYLNGKSIAQIRMRTFTRRLGYIVKFLYI